VRSSISRHKDLQFGCVYAEAILELVKRANVYIALIEVNRRENRRDVFTMLHWFRSRYRDYFRRNVD